VPGTGASVLQAEVDPFAQHVDDKADDSDAVITEDTIDEADGERYEHVPYHQSVLHKVRPVYETLPGWGSEIDGAERIEDLPVAAREYLRFLNLVARYASRRSRFA